MKKCLFILASALLTLPLAATLPESNQLEQQRLQQEKEALLDSPEVSEEAYYEAQMPRDVEKDHNFLDEDHPLQEAPLPESMDE